MPDSYSLSLLVFVLFAVLTYFIVRQEMIWFTPASLFSILWCFVMGFSLISAPDYYFSPLALLLIVSMVLTFFVGGKVYSKFVLRAPQITNVAFSGFQRVEKQINRFYIAFVICGFIAVFFLLKDSGIRLKGIFDWQGLKTISSELSRMRYEGVRQSGFTMLFLSLAYCGTLFGGLLFAFSKRAKQRMLFLFILLPIFLYTFVSTARAVFLFALVLWVSSFCSASVLARKGFSKSVGRKTFLLIAGIGGFVFITFVFTQALRMNLDPFSVENLKFLVGYLRSAFSGNVSAFSIWFDNFDFEFSHQYFKNTFGGVYEQLGLGLRKPGVYQAQFDVNGQMSFTNIFTLFRLLIDDLSIYGAFIFLFALGFASAFLFFKSFYGSFVHAAILPGFIALLLWSFIASILAYNTILFACCLFSLIVYFYYKK